MKRVSLSAFTFSAAVLLLPLPAHAQTQPMTVATAMTDVNVRSGPGPEHPVIGGIKSNQRASVIGCIEGSLWCQVDFRGLRGWAYSQYLSLDSGSRRVAVSETVTTIAPRITYDAPPPVASPGIAVPRTYTQPAPVVTYRAPTTTTVIDTTGASTREFSGELIAPSATIATPQFAPPPTVGSYVTANPGDPVYLEGDLAVGAGVPEDVALSNVPDYRYQYVYVNDRPVLVDPATRRIVYVFR